MPENGLVDADDYVNAHKTFHALEEGGVELDPPRNWDGRLEHAGRLTPIYNARADHAGMVAVVATLADRWAIWNDEDAPPALSTRYLAARGAGNGGGVGGGRASSLPEVWLFLKAHGTVSEQPESGGEVGEGFRCREVYHVLDGERNIQSELYNHGPVTALIPVGARLLDYWARLLQGEDLEPYDTREDFALEGEEPDEPGDVDADARTKTHHAHAIRVIGWGADGGNGFWIVANSWGCVDGAGENEYGRNGHMRIRRSKGKGGALERSVFAGFPFLAHADMQPECCLEDRAQRINNIEVQLVTTHTLHLLDGALPDHVPPPLKLCKRKYKKNKNKQKNKQKQKHRKKLGVEQKQKSVLALKQTAELRHEQQPPPTSIVSNSKLGVAASTTWSDMNDWAQIDRVGFALFCACGLTGVVVAILLLILLVPRKNKDHRRKGGGAA